MVLEIVEGKDSQYYLLECSPVRAVAGIQWSSLFNLRQLEGKLLVTWIGCFSSPKKKKKKSRASEMSDNH
jgi:hypothetical protein